MERMQSNIRQMRGDDRQARRAFHLTAGADDSLAGATDQGLRVELEPEALEDFVGALAMVAGEEGKYRVDSDRRFIGNGGDYFAGGFVGVVVLAQGTEKLHRVILSQIWADGQGGGVNLKREYRGCVLYHTQSRCRFGFLSWNIRIQCTRREAVVEVASDSGTEKAFDKHRKTPANYSRHHVSIQQMRWLVESVDIWATDGPSCRTSSAALTKPHRPTNIVMSAIISEVAGVNGRCTQLLYLDP